ncbi:tetratricopeptide repeat protein [Tumebacillus flagellatus]|uniref:Uncharacterized protein n=1 Tax=Tumebacillus flagellatus TaxID=1157490 RepID=A0A074LTC8_9BACL|nr:tetratricopeptide repeat protein [Tumebacillus flagellatus]KEO84294.1 hypothetical protein EL26_05875 [Tumebacillus flagellatus]
MFEKPFALLNRAVDRIELQLQAADSEQRRILGEELVALRNACDKYVEQWLSFEERLAELSEEFNLELDGTLPSPELNALQEKLAALQQGDTPFAMIKGEQGDADEREAEEQAGEPAHGKTGNPPGKKSGSTLVYQIGDGQTLRPRDEQMVLSFRRGVGYFDLLMFPEAMEEFQRVLEIDGNFLVARLYLAFGCLAQGEYERASRHLNEITGREEDEFLQATIHSTYGHIFVAQEEYESALVEFETAAKLAPDFRDIEFNIACCHFNRGRLREALTHFQRALIRDPEDWEAHRLCGLIWEQLGNRDRAYRHMARAYDLNGAYEQVILDFALLSEQQGHVDQARALYKKALRYHPSSTAAFGGLGWIRLREGDVATAISLFKKQLSCSPTDRAGLFNLGWASYQARDYDRAERCFALLLRTDSRDAFAIAGLARVWSATQKRGEAKEQLLRLVAMETSAEKKLGLYHLGRLAMEEESYTQALRYFNAALVYDRDCVESLFYKGIAHYALGELERAQQCFEKCK